MKYYEILEVLANGQPSTQMYALEHDTEVIYKPAYINYFNNTSYFSFHSYSCHEAFFCFSIFEKQSA